MAIVTSKFTLLTCLFIHVQIVIGDWWISYCSHGYWSLVWNSVRGFIYLLYPLCGWVAEMYSRKLIIMQWAFVVLLINSAISSIAGFAFLSKHSQHFSLVVATFIIICLLGLGMFEANAIQFGMDQMLEASSEQLSSFIHWYYWCAHVGPLLMFYISVTVYYFARNCVINVGREYQQVVHNLGWIVTLSSSIQLILSVLALIATAYYKRKFQIEQISRNPLSIVYKILKYSYHHKYPERRSAFTYWENEIPSRIDVGMQKYGGPFTYEQVEDVKTMFKLLLLMVSLFGFHLSGDSYSFSSYTMKTMGCPSFGPLFMFVLNPEHIPSLVVVLAIPFYQLVIKKSPCGISLSLFKRIWIGLLLCLIAEACQCFYGLLMEKVEFTCPSINYLPRPSYQQQCLVANIKINYNSSCDYFCPSAITRTLTVDLSFVIPLIHGIAYVLVFLSVQEFICAQSPSAMKGIMIGVWYFMTSIKYFAVNNLDVHPRLLDTMPWYLYHGSKGIGIFGSIFAFSVVCRTYRYRERNETVNEQAIIEDVYERELLMNSDTLDSRANYSST